MATKDLSLVEIFSFLPDLQPYVPLYVPPHRPLKFLGLSSHAFFPETHLIWRIVITMRKIVVRAAKHTGSNVHKDV